MRALRIHDAAALEAAEAAAWYERERIGLGAEFERAIDRALDALEQDVVPLTAMPGAAGKLGAKRLFLKRFPYAVIVREYPTERRCICSIREASGVLARSREQLGK